MLGYRCRVTGGPTKRVVVIEGEDAAPEAMRPSLALLEQLGLPIEWSHPRVGQAAIEARGEPFPPEARIKDRVVAAAFGMDVFVYPGGCDPARDVVCFGPPFVVGEAEIDLMVATFEKALDSVVERWKASR